MSATYQVTVMDKKKFSERDICTKFITPALEASGWDKQRQLREEVGLTAGRVLVRGNKGMRDRKSVLRADYVLYFKPDLPLAVVEAKDNNHSVRDGIQQALKYAEMLDVPFAFSSNGDGFVFHDKTLADGVLEREITLAEFPSPEVLWERYLAWKGISTEQAPLYSQDYHAGRTARYYQVNAINRTVEAVIKGQKRVLLVMATGTGKTYTAFQIIWRLWKSRKASRGLLLDAFAYARSGPLMNANSTAKLILLMSKLGLRMLRTPGRTFTTGYRVSALGVEPSFSP